jgi:phospholipid transport system substrate-binding protein
MRPASPKLLFAAVLCLVTGLFAAPVAAAPSAAESFVSDNIQAGLAILNDKQLSAGQRGDKFQVLLLGVTDLDRVALFTLGPGGAGASPADRDAFVGAFRNYAVAVYRSYFQSYSGQTMTVTGSREHAPGDVIVSTSLADPARPGQPMAIDFRVNLNGPKPVLTDIGVAGVWLVPAQRADFGGFLSQHKGDVAALTAHLTQVAQNYQAAPPR